MSAVRLAASLPFSTLVKRSLSLGGANAFDYALQFLLPVILVRTLTPEAFGQYRLLWLAISTLMVVVPLSMTQSLYFFLPRADAETRRLHVRLTLVYLAVAGLLGALLIVPSNPWLPASMRTLSEFGLLVPAVAVLVAVTSMLDILPSVEEEVNWQIGITVSLSLLRTMLLGGAALITGELRVIVWLLLGLLLLKLLMLMRYLFRRYGVAGQWFDLPAFVTQFRHASPLGASSALYGLRAQGDQWVAAAQFSVGSFAAFSIATVFGPLVNLFRSSVNHVFLPSMSRLQAAGDVVGMLHLNSQANALVGRLVYPFLALAFAYASEIVGLIYTGAYVDAAPVMRIYVLGLLPFVVELTSLILLLREGRFALMLNCVLLVLSLSGSLFGAHYFGLAGAALGSQVTIYIDRCIMLRRLSRSTNMPIRQLQDWGSLLHALLLASVATLAARLVTDHLFVVSSAFGRLTLGSVVALTIYGSFSWFHRSISLATVKP